MVFFKHTYLYTNEQFFNPNFFFYELSTEKFGNSNSSVLKSSNEKLIVIKIVRDIFFYFLVYVRAIAYVAIWYSFAGVRAIDGKLKYSGAVAFHAGLTFRSVFRRTR